MDKVKKNENFMDFIMKNAFEIFAFVMMIFQLMKFFFLCGMEWSERSELENNEKRKKNSCS